MPIKKMPNGTYKVDVSLGIDDFTEKRVRTTRRGITKLRDARRIERELLSNARAYKLMIIIKRMLNWKEVTYYENTKEKI